MKTLNFYPYYEPYLISGIKRTTFRVSPGQPYESGTTVIITAGWNEDKARELCHARIVSVYWRRISELQPQDFEGESPDCNSRESAKLVLSAIYKTVLNDDDRIWVVKFEYQDKPKVSTKCL